MDLKQEQIIRAATKLFYEHGYYDTSFSMIAGEITLSRSSIAFFFNNKLTLANDVYAAISKERRALVAQELMKRKKDYNIFVSTAIEHRLMLNSARCDEHVRKFKFELNKNLLGEPIHMYLQEYMVDELKNMSLLDRLREEKIIKLHRASIRGSHLMLFCQYFDVDKTLPEEIDFDTFCDYYIRCLHREYGFEPEVSDYIVNESKSFYDSLNVRYTPYFGLEID